MSGFFSYLIILTLSLKKHQRFRKLETASRSAACFLFKFECWKATVLDIWGFNPTETISLICILKQSIRLAKHTKSTQWQNIQNTQNTHMNFSHNWKKNEYHDILSRGKTSLSELMLTTYDWDLSIVVQQYKSGFHLWRVNLFFSTRFLLNHLNPSIRIWENLCRK